MKFDDSTTYIMQMLLTPKDLSFVGYTYKNFDAVKGLHQSFGMKFYFWVEKLRYFISFFCMIATFMFCGWKKMQFCMWFIVTRVLGFGPLITRGYDHFSLMESWFFVEAKTFVLGGERSLSGEVGRKEEGLLRVGVFGSTMYRMVGIDDGGIDVVHWW
jgi:hypothetical protein